MCRLIVDADIFGDDGRSADATREVQLTESAFTEQAIDLVLQAQMW